MGKAIRTSLLVLLLACSAKAGYIPNDTVATPQSQPTSAPMTGWMPNGSPEPPSQPTGAVEEQTANGVMQNGVTDGLTQVALELLAALPSLL